LPAQNELQGPWARDKNGAMAKDPKQIRAHVTIRGRVQGVYFRASTVYEAQNRGLTGWVRNCSDGSVEAVAEGDPNKVEEWIAWCGRGPLGARVEKVEVKRLPYLGEFQAFQIKR
jgi:acylphosphatase